MLNAGKSAVVWKVILHARQDVQELWMIETSVSSFAELIFLKECEMFSHRSLSHLLSRAQALKPSVLRFKFGE